MGICNSTTTDSVNMEIERHLNDEEAFINRSVKQFLFFGTGSSGKNTLFQQINRIHGTGMSSTEFAERKQVIRQNIVTGILIILRKSQDLFDQDPSRYADCEIDMNDKKTCHSIQLVTNFKCESFVNEQLPSPDKMNALGIIYFN